MDRDFGREIMLGKTLVVLALAASIGSSVFRQVWQALGARLAPWLDKTNANAAESRAKLSEKVLTGRWEPTRSLPPLSRTL